MNSLKKNKIGIIGFGFVGQALYNSIKDKDSVIIYDKYKNYSEFNEIFDTDVVFVQVPTPAKETAKIINETLQNLKGYKGIVVIKSTILPDLLEIPKLNVISNPEFLNQISANDDFANQKNILLGGDAKLCYEVQKIYETSFNFKYDIEFEMVSFEEALTFKYIRNIKIVYDVMFANFIQDCTGNYRKYNLLFKKFKTKDFTNYIISADGNPGFGGACLPKDTFAWNEKYKSELTQFLLDYNDLLKKN